MEKHSLLHLSVVAIGKGAFGSTSTEITNNIFFNLALLSNDETSQLAFLQFFSAFLVFIPMMNKTVGHFVA